MKVMTKKELAKMPVGTIFQYYHPYGYIGDIFHVITKKTKDGWEDKIIEVGETDDFYTNFNYADEQEFSVYEKSEIMPLVKLFTLGIADNN